MSDPAPFTPLLRGDLGYVREHAEILTAAGFEVAVLAAKAAAEGHPPALFLAVKNEQAPAAQAVLEAHWNQGLDEGARRAVEAVVDLDSETSTCPGCETTFETAARRCPECGLSFGAD